MRISDFAEKYGISTREVNYWTDLGLIHNDQNGSGGYRDYGPKAEEEIKKVLIAKAMNVRSIEKCVKMLDALPRELWKPVVLKAIDEETKRISQLHTWAKIYATEFMESL